VKFRAHKFQISLQLIEVTGIKSSHQIRRDSIGFEGVMTIEELRDAPPTLAIRFKDIFALMGIVHVHPDVSMHAGRVARLLCPNASHRLQMAREGIQHMTVHHTKASIIPMLRGILDACQAADHRVDIQHNVTMCLCPSVQLLAEQLEIII